MKPETNILPAPVALHGSLSTFLADGRGGRELEMIMGAIPVRVVEERENEELTQQRDEPADALEALLSNEYAARLSYEADLLGAAARAEATCWVEARSQARAALRAAGRPLVFLLFLLLPCLTSAQTLSGTARVVDGDTLEVQGQKVRLHGIDAPEKDQLCQRRKGSAYHCGLVSLVALEELLDGQPVTCEAKDRDRYGRVVARCFVGQPHADLSGWMVRQGLAVAYLKYSADYAPQEAVARGAHLGLWAGTFVPPSEWRKGRR